MVKKKKKKKITVTIHPISVESKLFLPGRNPEWWVGILTLSLRLGNGNLEKVKGYAARR